MTMVIKAFVPGGEWTLEEHSDESLPPDGTVETSLLGTLGTLAADVTALFSPSGPSMPTLLVGWLVVLGVLYVTLFSRPRRIVVGPRSLRIERRVGSVTHAIERVVVRVVTRSAPTSWALLGFEIAGAPAINLAVRGYGTRREVEHLLHQFASAAGLACITGLDGDGTSYELGGAGEPIASEDALAPERFYPALAGDFAALTEGDAVGGVGVAAANDHVLELGYADDTERGQFATIVFVLVVVLAASAWLLTSATAGWTLAARVSIAIAWAAAAFAPVYITRTLTAFAPLVRVVLDAEARTVAWPSFRWGTASIDTRAARVVLVKHEGARSVVAVDVGGEHKMLVRWLDDPNGAHAARVASDVARRLSVPAVRAT